MMVNITPRKEHFTHTYAVRIEIEGEVIRELNVIASTPEKAEEMVRRRLKLTAHRA